MHPKALGGFYFPRPHPSGCLPSLQALGSWQENISLFSHAWFQQSILSLNLLLTWSSIRWSNTSTGAGPLLRLLSFRVQRRVHSVLSKPPAQGWQPRPTSPALRGHCTVQSSWHLGDDRPHGTSSQSAGLRPTGVQGSCKMLPLIIFSDQGWPISST